MKAAAPLQSQHVSASRCPLKQLPITSLEPDRRKQMMFHRRFIFRMLHKSRWVTGETPEPTQPTTGSPHFFMSKLPGVTPWEPVGAAGADVFLYRCCNCNKTFNSGTPINHKAPLTQLYQSFLLVKLLLWGGSVLWVWVFFESRVYVQAPA